MAQADWSSLPVCACAAMHCGAALSKSRNSAAEDADLAVSKPVQGPPAGREPPQMLVRSPRSQVGLCYSVQFSCMLLHLHVKHAGWSLASCTMHCHVCARVQHTSKRTCEVPATMHELPVANFILHKG